MTCDHDSICYCEGDCFFKCKNCKKKLLNVETEVYKLFCRFSNIPITKLLDR